MSIRSHAFKVLAAFLAVYFIWGSTYLAIRYAVESIPPFFMAGIRNGLAGLMMILYARARGDSAPTRIHWRSAVVVGALMLAGGNGGVSWAEQVVPSGLAALLVATVPLWMVAFNAMFWERSRPTAREVAGIVLGFLGVLVLVGPDEIMGGGRIALSGAIVLVLASVSWSLGSLISRKAPLPKSPILATGMEMFAGGALLLVGGLVSGEWSRLDIGAVTSTSALSLAYLLIFGSLIGFTAYVWLLRQTTPARAATYAYVNPIVAVLLGWMLADEALTTRTLLSAAVIVGAVVIVTWKKRSVPQDVPDRASGRAVAVRVLVDRQ